MPEIYVVKTAEEQALESATTQNNLPTVRALVEKLDYSTKEFEIALAIVLENAVKGGHIKILEWLFDFVEEASKIFNEMADPTYEPLICFLTFDTYEKNPLELAVLYNRGDILPLLIDTYLRWRGKDQEDGNNWAQKALYLAVSLNNITLARYFLKHGYASPTIKDPKSNKTPVEVAKEHDNRAMLTVLYWYSTSYVVNSAFYIPSDEETDASDEEQDIPFTYEVKDFLDPPFKINSQKRGNIEEIAVENIDKVPEQKSKVRQQILDKLATEAFSAADEKNIPLSVSFGLNRPKSLSTGKNKLLYKEAKATLNAAISSLHFGFFWNYHWQKIEYTRTGTIPVNVSYDTVRIFYKQLKKYNPEMARNFRRVNEKQARNPMVPYREIREKIKNHPNTKMLVQQARNANPNAETYLSFIDSDTRKFGKFGGLFSTYSSLAAESKAPDVMTTGYEYEDEKSHPLIQFASSVDRQVRAATAKHVLMGPYVPEPNFAVKVLKDKETVEENFFELTETGNISYAEYTTPKESTLLLSKVRQRSGFSAIFSNRNPLLTTTPLRATKNKSGVPFRFSAELRAGKFYNWSWQDIINISRNVSQSHLHPLEWSHNLINGVTRRQQIPFVANGTSFTLQDGSVIRNIIISLFSRLFNSYDPVSLTESPQVLALNLGDEKTRFKYVLENYEALIKNGAIPTKERKETKHMPLEKAQRAHVANTKGQKAEAKEWADSLDSRDKIKQALRDFLVDCDPNSIELAARDSGLVIANNFRTSFDFNFPALNAAPYYYPRA